MSSSGKIVEESSVDVELDFSLHRGSDKMSSPIRSASSNARLDTQPTVDLELRLSSGTSESNISCIYQTSAHCEFGLMLPSEVRMGHRVGEGSTSDLWQTSWISSSLKALQSKDGTFFNQFTESAEPSSISDLSSCVTTSESLVTCSSGITQRQLHPRTSSSKTCQVKGCGKGARGASGHCISHGGGRRCQKPVCQKGAEGRTVYCKAHGGGRRCEFLGCTKSAEGRTYLCIAHGGGRRCSHDGCTRAARGKSGLCIRHGEGKRCREEKCTKSAEGLSGLCILHGGGHRCQYPGCEKSAQGSTMFCNLHGGGKRCIFAGCTKGAEGSTPLCKGHGGGKRCAFQGGGICPKHVHGGTNFCIAHGGGKRCAVPECTKSARGRTDFCVRHGGGKRCEFEGCDKSAQGSTYFCKAHGGGKRCSWGHPGYGVQPTLPCNSFSRGKAGLCALHSCLFQEEKAHGSVSKPPMQHLPKLLELPCDVYPSRSLAVNLRELYLCCTTTAHLQDLVNLQQIDLSNSSFTRMPDLSGSRKLQTLDLHGCKNLVDVSSVQYLANLEYLNLKGCTSLMSLPSLMALKFLSSIDVSDCKHLRRLPPSLGCLSCLTTLDLRNCKRIQTLPRSILRLKSLEVLSISGCSMLMERMSRVTIPSFVDTGLVYPPCSTSGSDSMVVEHQEESRGCHSSLHSLVAEIYSSNQPVTNDVSELSLQQFEEVRPRHKCDFKGKPSLERRTSYEMEKLTGSDDPFNPSSMDQDLKWTSDSLTHHRNTLKGYLNMPVEAIHQTNAFDKVGKTTETLILQCYNLEESESLQSFLYSLKELQESVPETMARTNDAHISRTSLQVKLAELGSSLLQADEEYSLLAAEFARMSEQEAELDAEIQRLLAKRDELVDENNTVVMH